MDTYQEIYDAIISRTKRPTQIRETENAIAAATLYLHNVGFFTNDLDSVLLQASSAASQFDVDFVSNPRVRTINQVIPITVTGESCDPLRRVTAATCKLSDTNWYRYTGKQLLIRTRVPYTQFQVEYYSAPVVQRAAYNSWIAFKYPYMVIDAAYERLCRDLGLAEEAQRVERLIGNSRIPESYVHILIAENEVNLSV